MSETLIKTPVFKGIVFWRLNERFMPNRTGDIFRVCSDALDKVFYASQYHSSLVPLDKTFPGRKI